MSIDIKEFSIEKKKLEDELKTEWLLFVRYLLYDDEVGGKKYKAYLKAYNVEAKTKRQIQNAGSKASSLLRRKPVIDYLSFLRESIGLKSQDVALELGKVLYQDEDLSSKLGAIKEFNKVKGNYAPREIVLKVDVNIDNFDPQLLTDEENRIFVKLLKKGMGNEVTK